MTQSSESESWNVHYDANSNTLHLNGATITGETTTSNPNGAGIYASASEGQPVSLNIVLQGENNQVSGDIGIYVYSPDNVGNATLTIKSESDGSLTARGSYNPGIQVLSNSGDATLTIQNADVTAEVGGNVNGVTVQAGSASSGGHTAKLEVNGGSLTATGGSSSDFGIYFYCPSSSNINLNVSNNAIVRANGGIASGDNEDEPVTPSGTGIVFNDSQGTVYGNVTLQENLEISKGESLDIPSGASLTIPEGTTLTVNGGELKGNVPQSGVVYKVTEVKLDKTSLTLDVNESETLTATITPDNATDQNVAWSSDSSNIVTITPDTSDSKKATITATGTGTTTIKATVDGKSAECSVTVNAAATVPVENVSLDKTNLELTEGETAQLTATVVPSDATNKNVTWSSNAPGVANVDSSGKVTAVGAGTATITVTTTDSGKTATCTVTVNPVQYTVTVQTDGNGTASASPATATAGTTVTLTADPDSGYHFERWEIVSSGVTISGNQFTMPAGNVTVKAVFDRNSSGFVPTRPWRPSRPVEPEDPAEPETPALNGWVQRDGIWYLYKDGSPATGWNLHNGTWYFLDSTGRMLTGWQAIGGVWYYLHDWGGMATGWLNLNGTWYYLHDWGGMATGWLNLNGAWYYLKDWGGMAVGWLNLNGTWYYLKDWGGMASNTTVDGYYLDVSGAGMA